MNLQFSFAVARWRHPVAILQDLWDITDCVRWVGGTSEGQNLVEKDTISPHITVYCESFLEEAFWGQPSVRYFPVE